MKVTTLVAEVLRTPQGRAILIIGGSAIAGAVLPPLLQAFNKGTEAQWAATVFKFIALSSMAGAVILSANQVLGLLF